MSTKNKKNEPSLSPKELRKKSWEEAQQNASLKGKRESDIRKEFKQYFIQLKRKLDLDASLEEIMWLHFKSAGYAKKESFNEGVEHFGYKINS